MSGPCHTRESTGGWAPWRQLLIQTRLETRDALFSAPVIILLFLALVFVVSFSWIVGENRGAGVYPLTYLMLHALGMSLQMFLVITVVFLSGELVHRERGLQISQVLDALPVPSWVYLGSKLLTLATVVLIFLLAGVLTTIAVQLSRGYFNIEPGLYLRGGLALALSCMLVAVLCLFVQVLANNKFVGYLLMVIFLGIRFGMPILGLEHNLLRYGGSPRLVYSDMNGYGHFVEPFLYFHLYWCFVSLLLLALSATLWVRGSDPSLASRLRLARGRWCGPIRALTVVAVFGALGTGSFIYFNTNILNDYEPRRQRIQQLAEYERRYRQYRDLPLPRIVAVEADVDIYPSHRKVVIRGTYRLENHGKESIRLLPITLSPRMDLGLLPVSGGITLERIEMGGHVEKAADKDLGFFLYELHHELGPGQSRTLSFEVTGVNRGFKNSRPNNLVVGNGSFFTNRSFFPCLGYATTNELRNPRSRQREGLGPLERTPTLVNAPAPEETYLDAHWIDFETRVSTSRDQIALAPGRLEDEWIEGDRRFFHYKAEVPILNFFVYLSADYQVARDRWQDVEIEIYHHPSHDFNIDTMMTASKSALEYLSSSLGPYPHSQLRIVEVPNYIGLTAASLAGIIPFSESWGFITRVGEGEIDITTEVVAHEIAHQWWNHQVIAGKTQGATMIAEALSQYAGVMVLEKVHGQEMVDRYLETELDRYLAGRGDEPYQEMPLQKVENQPYIHYYKGSVIMYALKDLVGEELLNQALQAFFQANVFQGPPYPTSPELLEHLRAVVPDKYQPMMDDMFETITLFDNRALEASFKTLEDGAYQVTLTTASRKIRSDGHGVDTEIPIDDWIDIGIFGEDKDGAGLVELYLEKRHIKDSSTTLELEVHGLPVRAGIDPNNRLIDLDSKDNLVRVTPLAH